MKILLSSVVLDGENKNVLASEFVKEYAGADCLDAPKNIVNVMNDVFHLSEKAEEYAYLICMNAGFQPISFFELSHGTVNASLIGIREIFVRAFLCGAVNIALCHNHPGGEVNPSEADIRVTEKIKEASRVMGLMFCDHIIISREAYCSLRENGKMDDGRKQEISVVDFS